MTKIIVATHERLAEGFQRTLNYIAPEIVEISILTAYVENVPVEEELTTLLTSSDDGEQIIILTDLLGGSVNQACSKWIGKENIHLIAGLNFPLLLSLVLEAGQGELSEDQIRTHIEEAKKQIIYVNDYLKESTMDMEDE